MLYFFIFITCGILFSIPVILLTVIVMKRNPDSEVKVTAVKIDDRYISNGDSSFSKGEYEYNGVKHTIKADNYDGVDINPRALHFSNVSVNLPDETIITVDKVTGKYKSGKKQELGCCMGIFLFGLAWAGAYLITYVAMQLTSYGIMDD